MWPSVPAFKPFGTVACPAGTKCELLYCIFSHPANNTAPFEEGRPSKRVKLDDEPKKAPIQNHGLSNRTEQPGFVGSIVSKSNAFPMNKEPIKDSRIAGKAPQSSSNGSTSLPRSATRPVSPPPKQAQKKAEPKPDVPVALTPRKLQKEPAQFTKRLALIKALRMYMAPWNEKVSKSSAPEIKALALSENQLNKLALDEEEQVAVTNRAVYENIIKQRLVALKKMSIDDWIKERKAAIEKESGVKPAPEPPKPVETGLTAKEEVILLQEPAAQLVTPQDGLAAFGYVTRLHTEAELEEARKTLASADHWEQCDRCSTRFQVFPERREEDGALTTGGKCKHHWGKTNFGKKTGKNQAPSTKTYTCCNAELGAPGCTTYDTHVFKASDPKRLALIMPFMETPENDAVEPHTAICFDCEMGYTTQGLELLRLTAVSWPSHKAVLDILVRPLGQILDVNTRFSGVTADQYFKAKPYDPANPSIDKKDLRIVDSPYIARDLFVSLISPSTPLVGHALENDLNAIRLIHPTIVDTVALFPHRQGLPYRHGLRYLTKAHLQQDIQQGGAAGHDSFEDAKATGELVRVRVAETWRKLKSEGWSIRHGSIFPPVPRGMPPPITNVETGSKRKLDEGESTVSDEPQPKKQK